MNLKEILQNNQENIAFIIGNGINRFPDDSGIFSWENLLLELYNAFSDSKTSSIPKGVTITEFYDLLDLKGSNNHTTNREIQKKVCELLNQWEAKQHVNSILKYANEISAPILTTNFDLALPKAINLKQYFLRGEKRFTSFYPWDTYFGNSQFNTPNDGFGIWYINGLIEYPSSIRLGLSHYMGSVERARNFIYKGRQSSLLGTPDTLQWKGVNTWLSIFFSKDLCIIGLSLEENEIFLRWLLIERAKYFKRYPDKVKDGWYITSTYASNKELVGKKYFLEGIGIKVIQENSYDDIYVNSWQNL